MGFDYFGMHVHRLYRTQPWRPETARPTQWPDATFGSWRLWDAYVSWPYLQPERSRWDFSLLDKYLSLAKTKHVGVLLPLGLAPTWASRRPNEVSGYSPGNAAPPHSMEDWREMVRKVVSRSKGKVEAYELWNEVNLHQFYTGSFAELVELARVMSEEVKRGDPSALLVSPSFTKGIEGVRALDQYLKLGGGDYADVIAFHFYTPSGLPEAMLGVVAEVREVMRSHGMADKPLWNTESGFRIENKQQSVRSAPLVDGWEVHDDATAAALLARSLIVARHAGIARYYWYAWDNIDMGLLDAGSGKPKLAAQAYSQTVAWLRDRDLKCSRQTQGLWQCSLDGGRATLLWSEAANLNWQAPAGVTVGEAINVVGQPVSHADGRLEVGPMPVKVELR